jgi:hypothetical protein
MIVGSEELHEEASSSLQRIQKFDTNELARESDLGTSLNFKDAITPAQQLVDLYGRLSIIALDDFPDAQLTIIKDHANAHFKLFSQILEFSPEQQNPHGVRKSFIDQVIAAYPTAFLQLHPFISYSLHRSADFQRLDTEARATLQSIEDKAKKVTEALAGHESEAQKVLDEIRNVAAEEGVTQQAAHFKAESEHHDTEAEKWRKKTINLSWLLGAYAVVTLFLHKIAFLAPTNTYDTVQLGISKVLIFAVIAYVLFLSARNFLNHKHNAILNKHRQNALMTHKALIEASGDTGVREAIMLQAASCIFSPQPTGYAGSNEVSSPKSMVEILSKPMASATKQSNN